VLVFSVTLRSNCEFIGVFSFNNPSTFKCVSCGILISFVNALVLISDKDCLHESASAEYGSGSQLNKEGSGI
jgi:hypothetical protein